MGRMLTKPYHLRTALPSGQYDANGKPILRQIGMNIQIGETRNGFNQSGYVTVDGAPVATTLTVADNTFADPVIITLGPYTLTNGINYAKGAAAGDTAVAIAAAISRLEGFSATAALTVVTIVSTSGLVMQPIQFKVHHEGTLLTIQASPTSGYMSRAPTYFGAPSIQT